VGALDVHKLSIVAAVLPPVGGQPEIHRIETTANAIRRFVDRLGGPAGLAALTRPGPGGFDLLAVRWTGFDGDRLGGIALR
jgi:hypothetical protein